MLVVITCRSGGRDFEIILSMPTHSRVKILILLGRYRAFTFSNDGVREGEERGTEENYSIL